MIITPILEEIIRQIVVAISPDKIIVLGYIDKLGNSFSIFNNSFNEINDPEDINLLIIADCSKIDRNNVLDMVEQRCKVLCRLALIWISPAALNNQLGNNSSFAVRSLQSGTIIYQKWEPAPHIQKTINEKKAVELDKSELFCWYERSQLFSQMAAAQRRFGNYGMAAFCIHQAVEQLLIMLIIKATGYRYGLHNLDRLLRVLIFHNVEATYVFSKDSDIERERLLLLRKVYISYRYYTDIIIREDVIEYFFCELTKLQELAERAL